MSKHYGFKNHPLFNIVYDFICSKEMIDRMKVAITLRYPPVDGIQEELYQKFKNYKEDRQFARIVGYCITVLFKGLGYEKDRTSCRCRNPLVVRFSTRFKNKNVRYSDIPVPDGIIKRQYIIELGKKLYNKLSNHFREEFLKEE